MLPEFKNLSSDEVNIMYMAPALVTVLIAGAEGNIDKKETDWGAKIAHFRAVVPSILQNYYHEVDKTFSQVIREIIDAVPEDAAQRSNKINEELAKLNAILPKLDPEFSQEFYKSMLSLSKQVAKASGGIWGYGSISPEEQKYLDLDVINPPGHEETKE